MIYRISLVWKVLLAAGILAFSYLVWPTPYRYDHLRFGSASTVARTSRLTGNSEILDGNKWARVRAAEGPVEDMTSAQIGKLKGKAIVDDRGQVKVSLYNGTSFKLKEITVEVTVHQGKSGKVVLDRLYRMSPDLGGGPLEMTSFEADLGFQPDFPSGVELELTNPTLQHNGSPGFDLGLDTDSWQIKSAKGARVH